MNELTTRLAEVVAVLKPMASGLFATIGNVAADKPEPARQVLVFTVVLIALAWLAVKIVKKVSKG